MMISIGFGLDSCRSGRRRRSRHRRRRDAFPELRAAGL